MTKTEKQLNADAKKQLKVIADIFVFAKKCIEYSSYLDVPNSSNEFDFIINSPSYSTFKFATARCSVIELSKLYGRSTEYNIINFLKDLIKGKYGNAFSKNENLIVWLSNFDAVDAIILKCIGLRDKAYAHTDKITKIHSLKEVYYQDVHKLVDVTERFIIFIYKDFFNLPFSINTEIRELKNNVRVNMEAKSDEEN